MISAQCALIGTSSSPVTRRSSGLMPPVGSSSSSSLRPERQRHGDLEPLLLAVAQLARQVVGAVDQPEALEQRCITSPSRARRGDDEQQRCVSFRRDCSRQQHVVVDRELGQHGGDLEFQAEPGAGALVGRARA